MNVPHILLRYGAYLNLDKEIITSATIIDAKLNLELNHEALNKVYLGYQYIQDWQCLGVSNPLDGVHGHICLCLHETEKGTQDSQAVFFAIHKWFLGPDHVAWQAAKAERKLQTSHYDSERKGWYWDKYVSLHKEKHTIMGSLTDYGYSEMDNGTKVCHFFKGIKSTELEAVVNVVQAQPEKYGMDFNAIVSYLDQMVLKIGLSMQLFHIGKTQSQLVRHKVVAFSVKVECKKYPKAVSNSRIKGQQMQVRKLCKQQDIKPAANQTSAYARTAALEAKLGISSQSKGGDVKKTKEETPKEQCRGKTEGILQWLTRHWVASARNLADS